MSHVMFLCLFQGRLDWSQPILSQIEAIAPHYDEWVNTAVYRKCRLFASPALEALTFTPWYLVPMFWVPIILYLGYTQYLNTVDCRGNDHLTILDPHNHIYGKDMVT